MAKQGLTINTALNLVNNEKSWALCVGSGISFPLFPLWNELAKRIVLRCEPKASGLFEKLSERMSPEVILQSAADIAKKDHNAFSKELADTLYEDFFKCLSVEDKQTVKKCLTCDPGALSEEWGDYLKIIQRKTSDNLTALALAKTILKLREKGHAPASILSFNAEMLLGSLMNAVAHEEYGERKKFFDYIIEPISYHDRNRIPYYFCHGVMPVPGTNKRAKNTFDADDRLVFLENEYLQLANSSFSWQSSAFINTLTTHTVFFVGLSFVDPNIRRWLAWIQEEKQMAFRKKGLTNISSTSHYWIEKKPGSTTQMRIMESSVSHLGIRIIWIDDWKDVSSVLEKGVFA